jgi:hypothetical protein
MTTSGFGIRLRLVARHAAWAITPDGDVISTGGASNPLNSSFAKGRAQSGHETLVIRAQLPADGREVSRCLREALFALRRRHPGQYGGHLRPVSPSRDDDPGDLELAIGPRDGPGRDAEVAGEPTDRRERGATGQGAGAGHGLDLPADLLVRRHGAVGV